MLQMRKEDHNRRMMKDIKGLGNDIIEIERIRKSINRHGEHFLGRLFTKEEKEYCYQFKDASERFAGRFAAKEAISKALGTGFGAEFSWHDVEILANERGRPIVHFSDKANKQFQNPHVLLSISHCESFATAVAVWSS